MISIEARDPEEAFNNLDEDEVIAEMLKTQSNSITIEFGECKPYVYKDSDDCEYFKLGEIEVTDSEMDINWFEIACELFTELNKKDK